MFHRLDPAIVVGLEPEAPFVFLTPLDDQTLVADDLAF